VRKSDNAKGKITRDVHTKDGDGRAEVSNGVMLADVGFGGGNLVEGIRDHEDVVDVDKDNAYAMEG
jgi:hypothetical protein